MNTFLRRLWRPVLLLRVLVQTPGQCHALSTATRLLPIIEGSRRLLCLDYHAPPVVPLLHHDLPRRHGDHLRVELHGGQLNRNCFGLKNGLRFNFDSLHV